MTLTPLLEAPVAVQVHTCAALLCLLPTTAVLLAPKGTRLHMAMGSIFAVLIMITAGTSFWIRSLIPGYFSPIHIFSVVTVIGIPMGLLALRRGDTGHHRRAMIGTSIGLVAAGAFTLLPGRIMSAVLFGN